MRRLTRETCDQLVNIPMLGSVESLNVSVASAVCLSSFTRQPIMHQNGFTTTILHSDRQQSVEHGAVHKPMHPSSEFAYDDARELAAVFQGKAGFTRQGHGQLRHGDGRAVGHLHDAAAPGRPPGVQPVRVRQHQQPAGHVA
ncbi:hypothetical protein G6F31_018941 [Rhizopus arrhizus]|nr:hypothetical protein G6F31_018941 [Rhizopus arrhizus]